MLQTIEYQDLKPGELSEEGSSFVMVSIDGCQPCETMKADLEALFEEGSITEPVFYVCLQSDETFPTQFVEKLGVRQFPTLFLYWGSECTGAIRDLGVVPINMTSKEHILAKIERIKKRGQ